MGLVLDTNVFIHQERTKQSIDFSRWESFGDVYISSVTASELLVGVHYAQDDAIKSRRTAYVERILTSIPVLGFHMEEARIHSALFTSLSKQGQMIEAHDLIIAATALAHNCAVLTDNIREFSRVPGLEAFSFLETNCT